MYLIPKYDIKDIVDNSLIRFNQGKLYPVKDKKEIEGKLNVIVYDNFHFRNYISVDGNLIEQFMIG